VVEGTSLENWRRGDPFVSSNLTASARVPIPSFFGHDQRLFRLPFNGPPADQNPDRLLAAFA
ncbi:MAG TPA: hypothetical protein VF797_01475, partial [Noviherbaspirillum sp.]